MTHKQRNLISKIPDFDVLTIDLKDKFHNRVSSSCCLIMYEHAPVRLYTRMCVCVRPQEPET